MAEYESVCQTAREKSSGLQYLSVEEARRQRANSDPGGLHIFTGVVPEITVTGEDGRDSSCVEDDEFDSLLVPPPPRPRSNTCPEDLFRDRKGRPPTPPPVDLKVLRNRAGKRFSFNFTTKDIKSISFIHHKLSKVKEEKSDSHQRDHGVQVFGSSACAQANVSTSSKENLNRDECPRLSQCSNTGASTDDSFRDPSTSSHMKKLSLTEHVDEEQARNNNRSLVTESRNINPELSPGVRACGDCKLAPETIMTATA